MKHNITSLAFTIISLLVASSAFGKSFECAAYGVTESQNLIFDLTAGEHFVVRDNARGIEDNVFFGPKGIERKNRQPSTKKLAARIMNGHNFILDLGVDKGSAGTDSIKIKFEGDTIDVGIYRPSRSGALNFAIQCRSLLE